MTTILAPHVEPTLDAPSDDQLYHRGWERWIASNLLNQVSARALVRKMISAGFSEDFAWRELERTARSPVFEAAVAAVGHAEKLRLLLDVLGQLRTLAPPPIDRVRGISATDFNSGYLAQNRPVVIEGLAAEWPAAQWTFPYLADAIGDVEVDVASGREADPRYEDNFLEHVNRMSFAEFVSRITSGADGNDVYLVSKNRLLRQPCAAKLLADIPDRLDLLGDVSLWSDAGLWVGPAGTVTPLHHDACNILFVQLVGRKRLRLVAPTYVTRVYNDRNCFTDFDPELPDYERFPQMEGVPIDVVELGPGDALLLPVGWWHHVRALDASVSLSLPRFDLQRRAHVWKWREAMQDAQRLLPRIVNRN